VAQVTNVGAAATVANSAKSSSKGIGSMTSEDFYKVLVTQLQQQDPMNPMSNEAMVQQISTIRNMEMSQTLTDTLQKMTSEQRFAGAAGLIGKYVAGVVTDDEGTETTLEGLVTGVKFTDSGKAILELDTGDSLPVEKLTDVYAVNPEDVADAEDAEDDTGRAATKLARATQKTALTQKAATPSLGNVATFNMQNAKGLGLGLTLG